MQITLCALIKRKAIQLRTSRQMIICVKVVCLITEYESSTICSNNLRLVCKIMEFEVEKSKASILTKFKSSHASCTKNIIRIIIL